MVIVEVNGKPVGDYRNGPYECRRMRPIDLATDNCFAGMREFQHP